MNDTEEGWADREGVGDRSGLGEGHHPRRFWDEKPLSAMSDHEWESLCDGCGRCCLQKLEDEDSGEVFHTRVACRLLDTDTCRCGDYARRHERVADCLSIRPLTAEKLGWLPSSCAYRRLAEGRGLADWHPLISGDAMTVRYAGIGVHGRVVSEREVAPHELVLHLMSREEE